MLLQVTARGVAPENIVISGFSGGGVVALLYAQLQAGALSPPLAGPTSLRRVGAVVGWSTHTGGTEMLYHREHGVVFAAPPIAPRRVEGLPLLMLTAGDDPIVLPTVSDLSARTMHHLGASVTLKRFALSRLHARTPRQWHTVGEWLVQTLGLPAPRSPYGWEPPRVDSVSIAAWGPAALGAATRDAVAQSGARALISASGAFVGTLDSARAEGALLGSDSATAVGALARIAAREGSAAANAVLWTWSIDLMRLGQVDVVKELLIARGLTADALLCPDTEQRLLQHAAEVSVLLFTVTCRANHAHNLTRSP